MKKLTFLLLVAILLTACGPKPLDVVNAWQAALNKGDIDAALSHLADDATVTIAPPGPDGDGVYTGHAEIRGWYETIVSGKGKGTLTNCKADGETITCTSTYADEGLKAMGVDFIEGSWVAVIRDGRIQSYTFTITPESLAKFPPPQPSAAEQLVGVYLTTIPSEGIDYEITPGDYQLKLQKDLRWFIVDPKDGYIYVQGYFTATAGQLTLKTTGGVVIGSCANFENVYGWTLNGQTLTLTAINVNGNCAGEKFFLTVNPFTRQQ